LWYIFSVVFMKVKEGEYMTTNNNTGKYLCRLSVVFVSYLLIGSFLVSGDYFDLTYLLILYSCIITTRIIHIKNHILDEE